MFATMWDLGLEGIWEMIKDWGTSTWEEVQAAWNNPNPYERGKYFGEIFGMILFEVVLAIITWGVGSAIKNSARVSKIMNLFPDWADDMLRKHPDGHKNGDVELDGPDRNRVDADLNGPQKGTGTDSEIDELANKDKNQQIEDDIKDGEPDADAKRAAKKMAESIVTAGDVAGKHPSLIMPELWALTTFKGVRGFSFTPLSSNHFEIFMHGSKKRIKPKDGKYDTAQKKDIQYIYSKIESKWGEKMTPDDMREIQNGIDRVKSRNPLYSKDGSPFENSSLIDPNSQRLNTGSTYTEWTVKTPGLGNRGERRIVLDMTTGQAYYSHDHYKSFIEIAL